MLVSSPAIVSRPLHAMSNIIRAALFFAGGLCWFAAALLLCVFTWSYIAAGAGLQFFTMTISSGSVLLGLIHVIASASGACICFAIGIAFCAHGLVPPVRNTIRSRDDHAA